MLTLLAQAAGDLSIGNVPLQIAAAIALILVAAFLLFLEILVVSGGIIGIAAAFVAGLGCYLAYEVGPVPFYITLLATPLTGVLALRYGLKRMAQSNMVSQEAIEADAGYHNVAKKLGIDIGSVGTLKTHAMPTGRAKFANGEIDVIIKGTSGSSGDKVKVIEIDGPSIFVILTD